MNVTINQETLSNILWTAWSGWYDASKDEQFTLLDKISVLRNVLIYIPEVSDESKELDDDLYLLWLMVLHQGVGK